MTESIWQLRCKVTKPSTGLNEGQIFEASEIDAIKLLESGQAELNFDPDNPPLRLHALLCEWISNVEEYGPELTNPRELSIVDEIIFKNGLRRSIVGDAPLIWHQGKSGLREMIGMALCKAHGHNIDLFLLFRQASLPSTTDRNDKRANYADEIARERPSGVDSMDVDVFSRGFSAEALRFTYDALVLQADFEDLLTRSISQGRIVVGQAATAGDRFIPPAAAKEISICDFDDSFWFALASDLPTSLFRREIPLDARRKKLLLGPREPTNTFQYKICVSALRTPKRL